MSNSLTVDGSSKRTNGQATSALSQSVVLASDQDFVKAEDAAAASGDKGIGVLFRRNSTNASLTDADGDYGNPTIDITGATRVTGSIVGGNGSQMLVGTGSSNTVGADGITNVSYFYSGERPAEIAPYVYNGASWDKKRTPAKFTTVALTAATAETTAWTPGASKKFRLIAFVLTASAQTVLTIKDNTAGTTILVVELAANVPFLFNLLGNGVLSAAANNVLTITRGTSAILNGTLIGCEE